MSNKSGFRKVVKSETETKLTPPAAKYAPKKNESIDSVTRTEVACERNRSVILQNEKSENDEIESSKKKESTFSKLRISQSAGSLVPKDNEPIRNPSEATKNGMKDLKEKNNERTPGFPDSAPARRRSMFNSVSTSSSRNKMYLPQVTSSKEKTGVLFGNDGTILLPVNSKKLTKTNSNTRTKYGECPKLVNSETEAKLASIISKYAPKKTDSVTDSSTRTKLTCEKNQSILMNIVKSQNQISSNSKPEEPEFSIKPELPSENLPPKESKSSESNVTVKSEVQPKPRRREYSEELMSGALAEKLREHYFAGKLDTVNKKLAKEGKGARRILELQLQNMEDQRDELVHDAPYRFKCLRASLVRDVLKLRGWIEEPQLGRNWDVHWSELSWLPKYFGNPGIPLKPHQKILHFRNCIEMTRKNLLVKNLRNLRHRMVIALGEEFAKELDFMPETFLLPLEHQAFAKKLRREAGSHWIIKPSGGAQGKDIVIVNSEVAYNSWRGDNDARYQRFLLRKEAKEKILKRSLMPSLPSIAAVHILEDLIDMATNPKKRRRKNKVKGILPDEKFVVQRYIGNPMLLCGRKFDIRFYVLVTSMFPLKAYMYREGFCRVSLGVYSLDDTEIQFTHLTNIAVQKKAKVYDDKLAKWPVERFMLFVEAKYGEQEKFNLANGIDTIVVKTLQSVEVMIHQDHHCFECYGFDVIFDHDLKPWLLEVNAAPSLIPSNENDFRLKLRLVDDTITVLNVDKRLSGNEKRIGGYDLFWDSGPVYAEVDEDRLRSTPSGKLPRLNTYLGASNDDRESHLTKTFDISRNLRKLVEQYWSDQDPLEAKIELDKFYRKKGYKFPEKLKNIYAPKTDT